MAVVKFIELSGRSSESFEDAVRQTVERASRTIRNIQSRHREQPSDPVPSRREALVPGWRGCRRGFGRRGHSNR